MTIVRWWHLCGLGGQLGDGHMNAAGDDEHPVTAGSATY